MKLTKKSVEWAIKHISKRNDTDIFPKQLEIDAVQQFPEGIIDYLCGIDVNDYPWKDSRRFIIPKSENSYRIATQLHIIDSIMLAAIVYEFGKKIEKRRVPISENSVFSSRFKPTKSGKFYRDDIGWNQFWTECKRLSSQYPYATCLDISDFYNQIYHHTIEQQLNECKIPHEVSSAIMKLLGNITTKSSRGIPIGPHASHLLAELALIPFDDSLRTRGLKYCRYCDDIVVFSKDQVDVKIAVYIIAEILDKQQRLVLQQQKTKIMSNFEFSILCDSNITSSPVNESEREIAEIFTKRNIDPYSYISITLLTEEERSVLSEERIGSIINEALSDNLNFQKIKWLFRRLAQIGTPNALKICLTRYQELLPALNDIMQYFLSVAIASRAKHYDIGEQLLFLLNDRLIKSNDFFQLCILSLFSSTSQFDNITTLVSLFDNASSNVQREILLATIPSHSSSWISEHREKYQSMSPWCKRAFLLATSILPCDQKTVFLKKIVKPALTKDEILEQTIITWSLSKK